MTYYLDSNIVIFALKGRYPRIKDRMTLLAHKDIKIPSMVRAELITGVYKSADTKDNADLISRFIDPYETVPFDEDASEFYGRIRADLEAKGKMIGSNDLIIAATVMSRGGILVTNNTKEFERVDGLFIEDWSK